MLALFLAFCFIFLILGQESYILPQDMCQAWVFAAQLYNEQSIKKQSTAYLQPTLHAFILPI